MMAIDVKVGQTLVLDGIRVTVKEKTGRQVRLAIDAGRDKEVYVDESGRVARKEEDAAPASK